MSHPDDTTNSSKSLLRRLINEDQDETYIPAEESDRPETSPFSSDEVPEPIDEMPSPPPVSPIRPVMPDDSQPQAPLMPSLPDFTSKALSPREQMQRAEEALINLRQKMARLAAEFDQGKINQAQFDAIYARYSEQRDITERLLTRNPESQAWQSVVQPGHTGFLRQQYAARVLSCAIYDQNSFDLISSTGPVLVEQRQLTAVLTRLKTIIQERGNPGPAKRKIRDGRCVVFVPGELTISVVIFSLDPAEAQMKRVQDIHHDFERANQQALRFRDYTPERLVFPHRALFEERKI